MIPFVKAHACGNDFLIVQESLAGTEGRDLLARRLCRRNDGVGADGVEFFLWEAGRKGRIHLYNADGSAAEISGNGTRCAAAWMAFEANSGPGDELFVETGAGPRICRIISRESHRFEIASAMGVPEIRQASIALADGSRIDGAAVSTGNPHFVVFVDHPEFEIAGRGWKSVGQEISTHAAFARQTNVEFVRTISPAEIEIRIYERGVGPTTSSGTGTCAAASASIHLRGAKPALRVGSPGGTQTVHWDGGGSELLLTGPAELISFGEAF